MHTTKLNDLFVSRSTLKRKKAQQPADGLSEGCFDLGKLAGRQGHPCKRPSTQSRPILHASCTCPSARVPVCDVCVQAACCCWSRRLTRPSRCQKLHSIALESVLHRDTSWASQRRRHVPRRLYYACCSRWSVAALSELERCVTPVSVRMGDYWCVLDGYGVRGARGANQCRCRALRGG